MCGFERLSSPPNLTTTMSLIQPLLSICKSQVPKYLHDSELYKSLGEDDDELSVPADCLKRDPTVHNVIDLRSLLLTMRYWILTKFSAELIRFLLRTHRKDVWTEVSAILSEFDSNFPDTLTLVHKLKKKRNKFEFAAQYGRVDFLEYYLSLGKGFSMELLKAAAVHGHLDCLRFIHEQLTIQGICGLRNYTVWRDVVQAGQTECLRFLVDHGANIYAGHLRAALCASHITTTKYLLNALDCRDSWIVLEAAGSEDVNMLRCVVEHGCEICPNTWKTVLNKENTDCLLYLLDAIGQSADVVLLLPTVAYATLPALELLLARGYHFSPELVVQAAHAGNIPCLQFLHQRLGFECLLPTTMAAAAAEAQIKLVKWLHEQGCPWDESATTAALRRDSLECLSFFLDRCDVPETDEFEHSQSYSLRCRLLIVTHNQRQFKRALDECVEIIRLQLLK